MRLSEGRTARQLQGLGCERHVHHGVLKAGRAAEGQYHAQLAHLPQGPLLAGCHLPADAGLPAPSLAG